MIGFFLVIMLSFGAGGGQNNVSSGQATTELTPSERSEVEPSQQTEVAASLPPKTLQRELPMPLDQIKNIINLTKGQWVSFRDWDGKQLIYFTHLESWKCGISEVKYGINGSMPNQIWTLDECDLSQPNAVTKTAPYLSFALDQVQIISLQLTFDDGSQTEIIDFAKP